MKIVLRHKVTGRYYNSPGNWVRRADNALTFDDEPAAREFTRLNHLEQAQPVERLAPYLMSLLHTRRCCWRGWESDRTSFWSEHWRGRFFRN